MNARLKEVTTGAPTAQRNVYQAIAAVMGDLARRGISKDQTNTFDKYKFRGIDDVYNALAPLLAEHRLLILPRVLERTSEERTSKDGKAVFYITVAVEFDFVSADDGSKHTVRAYGEAMDRGDKGTNKAMTAAYKYACFEAFCIPVVGQDDADRETHEVEASDEFADWKAAIEGAQSFDELQNVWAQMGKPAQHHLRSIKDAAKARLSA